MKKLQVVGMAALLVLGSGVLSACNRADTGESYVREEPYAENGLYEQNQPITEEYGEPTGDATEEGVFEGNQVEEEGY